MTRNKPPRMPRTQKATVPKHTSNLPSRPTKLPASLTHKGGERFRWTKGIKTLYRKERFENFTYPELAKYAGQMNRGIEYLTARLDLLRAKSAKTHTDRLERDRILKALPAFRHARDRAQKVLMPERWAYITRPREYRAAYKMRYDKKIDPRNVMVLEAAGVATQVQPTSNAQSQREFAGGVHEVVGEYASKLTYSSGKWKGENHVKQKVQKITLAPYHVHAWNSDKFPLYVHSHPKRIRNAGRPINMQGKAGRKLREWNEYQKEIRDHFEREREIGEIGGVMAGRKPKPPRWTNALDGLSHEAQSIECDDAPSGGDISHLFSVKKPSLIITPRRNILLVMNPKNKSPFGGLSEKDAEAFENKLEERIGDADEFAWNRSGAAYPHSMKDAIRRLEKYQKLREEYIGNTLENMAGVTVTFYKKGEAIRYPSGEDKVTKAHTKKSSSPVPRKLRQEWKRESKLAQKRHIEKKKERIDRKLTKIAKRQEELKKLDPEIEHRALEHLFEGKNPPPQSSPPETTRYDPKDWDPW